MQNRIKVIISDLDGTLLNQHHTISEYTKTVFQELYNQGYLLIVATGGIISTRCLYCGHWMSNLLSDIKRGFILPKELLFLDISSEVIKSVLSLKLMQNSRPVCKENVWLTNKDNESLNSFQAELNYCRSS
jgi:beta-phosphoglucomutase-like phosphatase (HAD superfamily)